MWAGMIQVGRNTQICQYKCYPLVVNTISYNGLISLNIIQIFYILPILQLLLIDIRPLCYTWTGA